MIIHIKNLRLRAIIGVHGWERHKKQDIVINVEMEYDGNQAAITDAIHDTVDYKAVKKRIIAKVEKSKFYLLDKLTMEILKEIMIDNSIQRASVKVDKPQALRFADSVSITCTANRNASNEVIFT